MDIVHHSLIGGAGLVMLSSAGYEVAGAAFIIGSIFPDLDVIFMLIGKRFYLQNHQGITHSLFLAPIYAALLICLPLMWLLNLSWQWPVFFAALAGLVIHIALDLSNTFRIQLFSPFIKTRYSLDAVFFIDSFTLFTTTMFYLLHVNFDLELSMAWYPLALVCYVFAKWILHNKVQQKQLCDYAIPSAFNPFEFYILNVSKDALEGYIFNSLSNSKRKKIRYLQVNSEYLELARKSQLFNDIAGISRAFYITEVNQSEDSIELVAQDLAVRNFAGRFGKTKITFDKQGSILHEEANI